ncbi:hypothetical protein HGRIS_000048 [Hohenbuehelia grisea]|uniref:Uncharacterized protein n=1 Tax=Hohenbuehelia grisea TaxID=104357 RepID=A0ABR3JQI1_9AGAR
MYLENDDGQQLLPAARSNINKHAMALMTGMAQPGDVPKQYNACNIQTLTVFRQSIESAFPILTLCDGHWKADEVWIRTFNQWHDKWIGNKKSSAVKLEDEAAEAPEPSKPSATKRAAESVSESTPSKRSRSATPVDDAAQAHRTADPITFDEQPTPPPPPPKIINPLANLKVAPAATPPSPEAAPQVAPSLTSSDPLSVVVLTPTAPTTSPVATSPFSAASVAPVSSESLVTPTTPLVKPIQPSGAVPDAIVNNELSPEVPLTKATSTEGKKTSTCKSTAAEKTFEASDGITARAISGHQWKMANPSGTAREFAAYWKQLSKGDKQTFKAQEKELKKAAHKGSKSSHT